MKLLTIAIPTYNRALLLQELLESIFQDYFIESNINVFVSDNASSDGTESILKQYHMRHPESFSFHIASSNLGADANYFNCLASSRSQYIWLVGSDDLLHIDSIRLVMHALAHEPSADIHLFSRLNFHESIQDAHKQYFCLADCLDKRFSIAPDPTTLSLGWLLDNSRDIAISFTYISSCIVSSAGVNDVIRRFKLKFFGSAYIHVEIFLLMLSIGSVLSVHSSAPILNRCGNDSFVLGDRSKRRIIDYGLIPIAKHVFGSNRKLYRSYCLLLARQFLKPAIAIGDQSRALRDGGKASLKRLNIDRNNAFADHLLLSLISKLYGFIFLPVVLRFLFFCRPLGSK